MSDNAVDAVHENRHRWIRLGAIALVLPLLAASVLVWSTTGRQDKLDKIPVAIVNNDTILSQPQPMAAGRSLTAALTDPTNPSGQNLDWTLTDSDDARSGLKSGAYYAVLTIPSDFSSAIISSGTDQPVQGQLSLVSNSAASTTVPYISEQIASAAGLSLGNQTTQGYLKNVYSGFNKIAKSNQSAADSAAQLAEGTQQLAQGAATLDDGADSLSSSLDEVATGAAALQSGTASVASGADEVQQGAVGVSRGAAKLHTGAADLAGSARTLASQSRGFAGKAHQVSAGAAGVSAATGELSKGTKLLTVELYALSRVCTNQGGSVQFCNAVTRARDHARTIAEGSVRVDQLTAKLSRSTTELANGATSLANADARLARGAASLSSASDELSASTRTLVSGATSVATGASTVNSSAGALAQGTQSAAAGGASLASGAASLSTSAASVTSGAHSLSSGLANGAEQSPTYSSSQQDALAVAVSQPVDLTHTVQHTSHGNGWLLAAVVAVILWLGALTVALSRNLAAVLRHARAPIASRRLVLVQLVPVVGLALVQGLAVLVAVRLFHASIASAVPFALLSLLAAATFALLAYVMRLALHGAGMALFVLLLLVQVAALGNVIPLETAPTPLQVLNGFLPLTAYTNGASRLVSGGDVGSLAAVVTVLVVWALVACGATVLVVKRRRVLPATSRVAPVATAEATS